MKIKETHNAINVGWQPLGGHMTQNDGFNWHDFNQNPAKHIRIFPAWDTDILAISPELSEATGLNLGWRTDDRGEPPYPKDWRGTHQHFEGMVNILLIIANKLKENLGDYK
jgi:hypothetical protein